MILSTTYHDNFFKRENKKEKRIRGNRKERRKRRISDIIQKRGKSMNRQKQKQTDKKKKKERPAIFLIKFLHAFGYLLRRIINNNYWLKLN